MPNLLRLPQPSPKLVMPNIVHGWFSWVVSLWHERIECYYCFLAGAIPIVYLHSSGPPESPAHVSMRPRLCPAQNMFDVIVYSWYTFLHSSFDMIGTCGPENDNNFNTRKQY